MERSRPIRSSWKFEKPEYCSDRRVDDSVDSAGHSSFLDRWDSHPPAGKSVPAE